MILKEEIKENKTWYRWEDRWCKITILKDNECNFYTTCVEMKKELWQIELISYNAKSLYQAKTVASKMIDICLWYNTPEPWKE